MAEVSPTRLIPNVIKAIGRHLLPACYAGTLAIAMVGWLWGIGRMVVGIVNWLLA